MNEATVVLQELLDANCFRSRVDDHIKNRTEVWELDIADPKIESWVAEANLHKFADSLKSTAVGLLELAKTDEDSKLVFLIKDRANLIYPFPSEGIEIGKMDQVIVGYNSDKDHSCEYPCVWGMNGSLKLQAIIFCCCTPWKMSTMDLIFDFRRGQKFPNKEYDDYESFVTGFTTIRVQQTGELRLLEGSLKVRSHPLTYLNYCLGKWELEGLKSNASSSGGSIEDHLHLPGAQDFIAKHLSSLGEHFKLLDKE